MAASKRRSKPGRDTFRRFLGARSARLRQKVRQTRERLLRVPAVELIVRTFQELGADDATHMAAGVSYYAILSIFPLILGLIAVLGFFLPQEDVQQALFDFLEQNIPAAVDLLERNISQVVELRGALGLVSLLLLFWSASAMFGAIDRAVNRAWDVHKDRPFHVRKVRDIGMALGTGVLFLLSFGATSLLDLLRGLDVPGVGSAAAVGARLLGFVFSIGIFLAIYKFVPNTRTFWRYIWPGALLAAVLYEIAKSLFVFYLANFANYQSVYGSLGVVIVLLLWIYISAFILILGAQFSSELGRMRRGVGRGTLIADAPQCPDSEQGRT